MICPACCAGAHADCDDEIRRVSYGDWLRGEFKEAHPVVDAAANVIVHASWPRRGCDCQHGARSIATEVPQSVADPSSERSDIPEDHAQPA